MEVRAPKSAFNLAVGKMLIRHVANPAALLSGSCTLKKGTTVRNCTVRLYADCRTSKPSMSLAAVIFWSLPDAANVQCHNHAFACVLDIHTQQHQSSFAPSFIMSSALLYDSVSEASVSFTHTPAVGRQTTVTERTNSMKQTAAVS